MGIGASIVLLAVGAVLAFAVDVSVPGLSVTALGVIAMVAGAAGLALAVYVHSRDGAHHRR